jgi:hypothetical protein
MGNKKSFDPKYAPKNYEPQAPVLGLRDSKLDAVLLRLENEREAYPGQREAMKAQLMQVRQEHPDFFQSTAIIYLMWSARNDTTPPTPPPEEPLW